MLESKVNSVDVLLKDLGYESNYTLSKENHLVDDENDEHLLAETKLSLGQRIDIVLSKSTLGDQHTTSRQLNDILGTRYIANDHLTSNNNGNKVSLEHKYKHNDQLRMERFDELLKTEENYIRKLQPLVNTIVKPLKLSCAQDKHPVLKQYMCTNIFLNLENILDLHQLFLKDLKTHRRVDFAALCCTHMGKMDRYRRYLLKVNEAHELHTTEYQKNQAYRSFIIKATANPAFQKLHFENLLDEPWKRITAYVVLLEDIRNCTSMDHPDFAQLTDAFTQINTIASVRDDLPTMLATKSHDLYLSIRKAPCHLIKQSRSLVTHLDAVEINGSTGKLSRHVTLFLFCDKIMVASRSSHAKGADICDDGSNSGPSSLTNLAPKKKKSLDFKFCGWVGLQHIDLIQGPLDLSGSVMVRASSDFQDSITETGYEKYFKKGTRMFTYQAEPSRQPPMNFIKKRDAFVDAFYKTQAVNRQYGNQDATYHRHWNGHQVYSNVYDQETYAKTEIKNNVAAIFLEKDSEADIPSLLNSNQSSPWIVVLVRPDSQESKLNVWSKIPLPCNHDPSDPNERFHSKPLDFTAFFLNNVIKCERKLQCSTTYRLMNGSLGQQEIRHPPRSRSQARSRKSMTRSTSISSISRFFGRSRSQSPFSSSASSSPFSSTPHLILSPSKSTPSKKQEMDTTTTGQHRLRSHSLSNDSTCLNAKLKLITADATRRRKLSFGTSFFKIDIKSPITNSVPTTAQAKPLAQICQVSSPQTPIQQLQNSAWRTSLSQNSKQHYQSATSSPTTARPIPVPSATSPLLHPTDLSSSNIYFSSQQIHRPSSHTSLPSIVANDDGKQRQLVEKLDAIYHDMAGIGRLNLKDRQQQQQQQQARHTSDPLVSRSPSRTNSSSPISTFSSYGNFGATSSSRSSSYTNTFSSYSSQSTRSSISSEEMDSIKGYGPSPRLAIINMAPPSNNQRNDDEVSRKVMMYLSNNQKRWPQKSLSSHYTSVSREERNHHHHPHQPSPPPHKFPGPVTPLRPKATVVMEKEHQQPVLDHVSSAVDHFSYQVDSKWHFLLEKQRMLGSQINRVAELLPYDADTSMLNEMYLDTMDETTHFINKINTELEEISSTVNTYRQKQQYQPYRTSSSLDTPPAYTTHEADLLMKRKLKEAQLERDYWHRRASELTNQLNEFVLKQ